MASILEKKLRLLQSDYVTSTELSTLLPLSNDARYAQIKRALAEGYLTHLKRGLYRKSQYLEKTKVHPFEMAHYLLWPSYISLESALSYHGLIPEAVYTTTCATPLRSLTLKNTYGVFEYKKLPRHNFFMGVDRIEEDPHIYFIAKPWKALCDYVYCYKKNWNSLHPLIHSLRIDEDELPILSDNMSEALTNFYKSHRIDRFLKGVSLEHRSH